MKGRARIQAFVASTAMIVIAFASCADDPPAGDACGVVVDRSCAPSYEPTFDKVFAGTLKPSCALAGPSCHASAGHKAGLVLEEPEAAYRSLLAGRVKPGEPECSLLARRVLSKDPAVTMPPGCR